MWDTEKMRTNTERTVKLHHSVADIMIKPVGDVRTETLKHLIQLALDSYTECERVSAETVYDEARDRHGDYYQTPGYYLHLYRQRKGLTQAVLAKKIDIRQHHLSEMEHNKRTIGKMLAKRLAAILEIDYRKLL